MRKIPNALQLWRAQLRATAHAAACGLKVLKARERRNKPAAKQARRRMEFWMRRVMRLDVKVKAARRFQ